MLPSARGRPGALPSGSMPYFEETQLASIHEGDPVRVKLMGYSQIVEGHVGSIARGIIVSNAQPDMQGLANVNPIFTWVRLAQRVPVRICNGDVSKGVRVVAGMTATVQVDVRRTQSPNQPNVPGSAISGCSSPLPNSVVSGRRPQRQCNQSGCERFVAGQGRRRRTRHDCGTGRTRSEG